MIKRTGEKVIFKTKYFTLKDIDLETDSHNKATYQIIERADSVMTVPIDKDNNLLLVREYFYAIDEYQLGLPKGRVDDGSEIEDCVNKELQEEIGFKAEKIEKLGIVTISPGYITGRAHIFLARDLVASELKGDELENLELVKHPFEKFEELIEGGRITDSRMIAALFLAKKFLKSNR